MRESNITISWEQLLEFSSKFLAAIGFSEKLALEVAWHLVEADLAGIASHGVLRLPLYAKDAKNGRFKPSGVPTKMEHGESSCLINGNQGLGIPAMTMAIKEGMNLAKKTGTSSVGIINVGHTGRIGEFVETAADSGYLSIIFGGGSRKDWPQVVPFGGKKGLLPTNPYAFGIPGGKNGSVIVDFATSAAAGGKIYAAQMAEKTLSPGLCVNSEGIPTTKPEDYFNGGALLPMAGPKGYGMALVAELLGQAVFGPALDGMNWICICIDLKKFCSQENYAEAAELCLAEVRSSLPADGFSSVEIPGERERAVKNYRLENGIPIPKNTFSTLIESAKEYGIFMS